MISDNGKYYLYRHIRLDSNEVFYVGIGTKEETRTYKRSYARALSKSGRSKYWKNITNKVQYSVDIILESNDYNFIINKEREFISLYGRRDLGIGTLCNLTDGGEGSPGVKVDKYKISKKIYVYSLEGEHIHTFNSISDASKTLKVKRDAIIKIAKGQQLKCKEYRFTYDYKKRLEPIAPGYIHSSSKPTIKIKDGKEIETLSSILAYEKKYGYKNSNIGFAIKTGNKAYGFHWKHEETNN